MNREDSMNGYPTISQDMYEHFVLQGISYSGFVEDVGFVIAEVVATARATNMSGTEFFFDLQPVNHYFDIEIEIESDELENNFSASQNESDENNYFLIPSVRKGEYGKNVFENTGTFVHNTLTEIFNPVIHILNGIIATPQVVYHEGVSGWWDATRYGIKSQISGIGDYFSESYNYMKQTPAKQQFYDTMEGFGNPDLWEGSVAFGATLFTGRYGATSKAANTNRLLTGPPKTAFPSKPVTQTAVTGPNKYPPVYFPKIRGGYGLFGEKGLIIKDYKIGMMYRYEPSKGGGGCIISIKQTFAGGNSFRIEKHIHIVKNKPIEPAYWHYHFRYTNRKGKIYGSSKGQRILKNKL